LHSGYYAACAGLKTQTEALDLVANNLANVSTSGYRGQEPTFRSLLISARTEGSGPLNRAINDFNVLGGTRIDLTSGSMQRTGNPLDLAIEGKGFFAIQTRSGTMYTRNGNFQISATGQLTTARGEPVLGDQGPLAVPEGAVSISPDGTLSIDGAVAGRLRIVEFAASSSLLPEGNSNYSLRGDAIQPSPESYVRQGMIESSNVSPVSAMVTLLTVQRHAEMLGRVLSTFYADFDRIATAELPRIS
jgi:flagellar basal-body rod protein FlgF/flagellar basal-body rod protein FlgG